ncbi:hypothetical protein [Rhizobium leguminosarum]|uniref:hypothetical protein n=1 Tax=Rhizobium leguminosarum TaxID=384 RepID=UPI001441CBD0|nr:hypothetical protein [Rhizobium leguminosarum]MBY5863338.1 hypothetical protein [Rhizobium leguminosarum]NKM04216.1 hypothetical protein [Rhizobium leguminosarum bv. viciae]
MIITDGQFTDHLLGVETLHFADADVSTSQWVPSGILGTNGADVLLGTINADDISGLAGDDVISPGSRNDVVDGGDGSDIVIFNDSFPYFNATAINGNTVKLMAQVSRRRSAMANGLFLRIQAAKTI